VVCWTSVWQLVILNAVGVTVRRGADLYVFHVTSASAFRYLRMPHLCLISASSPPYLRLMNHHQVPPLLLLLQPLHLQRP
jgi:hypothetical protein